VLFSYELARRLQGTSVTADALDRGVVSTCFGAEDLGRAQRLFVSLMRPFMKALAQGAATSIHVTSAPELDHVTGCFFADTAGADDRSSAATTSPRRRGSGR
jgi:hypothetical protein